MRRELIQITATTPAIDIPSLTPEHPVRTHALQEERAATAAAAAAQKKLRNVAAATSKAPSPFGQFGGW